MVERHPAQRRSAHARPLPSRASGADAQATKSHPTKRALLATALKFGGRAVAVFLKADTFIGVRPVSSILRIALSNVTSGVMARAIAP